MAITQAQKAVADQRQWAAAQDPAPQVRVVAGPGTGKSKAIERRVAYVLNTGATPQNVYVISFTRATCAELRGRIAAFCLTIYPSDPVVLDDWERENLYDVELSDDLRCNRSRAQEIRLAHDAQWQTLNPQFVNQSAITQGERIAFNAFHTARANLYSCVLPGEVVYKCVTAIQQGVIQPNQLPQIDHLIVDEFQDLNACDQEFIARITANGATLFVAGDDDQSIYSFRHADPTGIVQFNTRYPASSIHVLEDVVRDGRSVKSICFWPPKRWSASACQISRLR